MISLAEMTDELRGLLWEQVWCINVSSKEVDDGSLIIETYDCQGDRQTFSITIKEKERG